jgi:hypothetical protein
VSQKERQQRAAFRRRLAWASAGALFLHGLLALVAMRAQKAPRPSLTAPAVVRVELRPAPKAVLPAPPAPAPQPEKSARNQQHPGQRRGLAAADPQSQRPPGASEAGATPEPPPEPKPQAQQQPQYAWGSPEWRRAEGLDEDPAHPGSTALPHAYSRWGPGWGLSKELRDPVASLGRFDRAGKGAPREENGLPVREPTREEKLAEEQTRVEEFVRDFVTDFQAHERVRDVRDAYWQAVQDALEKGFHPGWELRDSKNPGGNGLRGAIGEVVDQYRRQLRAYGERGTPLPGDSAVGARKPLQQEFLGLPSAERGLRGTVLEVPAPQLTLEALAAAGSSGDSPFHTKLLVRVLLTQALDGSIENAELVTSSGSRTYDELALGIAKGLGEIVHLGPPPKDHRRSLWAFDTDFLQMPPMPVAGCALDDFVPKNCFYPFKKSIRAGVHLEAVY